MKNHISKSEQLILQSLQDQGEMYGVPLQQHLKEMMGHDFSFGTIYTTAEALEKKGLITTRLVDDKDPERGGRPKRFFKITADGEAVLRGEEIE